MKQLFFLMFLMVLTLPGTAQSNDPQSTAQQTIATFQKTLMKELKQGLAHGPAYAINICRDRAPQIAADLSNDKIKIGRTTSRLRNPDNQGPEWATPYLTYYENLAEKGDAFLISLPDDKHGYVKPIYIMRPCLTCHGNNVSAEVIQALANQYPHDTAVGYEQGEFRGIFWAEIN